MNTVSKALIEAFVLIVIVLLLFLLNLRATLLVLISVPLSVGLALTAMSYWGLSANLMSLGGLAIAIGMMVDGSVVMMENIFKHLSHPDPEHDDKVQREIAPGDPDPHDALRDRRGIPLRIQEAAQEVGRPVFYAVIIIIVVFAPLFALQGVEGKLFQPMAISIVLAMLTSLVVALVVMPALATYSFRKAVKHRDSPVFRPLEWACRNTLGLALKARWLVVLVALAMLGGALALLPRLGTEFVPELEEGTINIRVTLAPSASLDTSLKVAAELEKRLMQFPEVIYASSRVGRAELGGDPEPVSNVEIYVGLKPVSEWTTAKNRFELQEKFQAALSMHPGLLFTFSQPIATRVPAAIPGFARSIATARPRAAMANRLPPTARDPRAESGAESPGAEASDHGGTVTLAPGNRSREGQHVARRERAFHFDATLSHDVAPVEQGHVNLLPRDRKTCQGITHPALLGEFQGTGTILAQAVEQANFDFHGVNFPA